jgi:hypothetical protein
MALDEYHSEELQVRICFARDLNALILFCKDSCK